MTPAGPPLPYLAPLIGPLAAIEAERRSPVPPTAFGHAKIVHVMAGRSEVGTACGTFMLSEGAAIVLGSGVWCSITPLPWVRTWTICVDESFLRQHMAWVLPVDAVLAEGVPPTRWDGGPLVLHPGRDAFRRIEPLLRRMSMSRKEHPATQIALFAQIVEVIAPTLLVRPIAIPDMAAGASAVGRWGSDQENPEVFRAVEALRGDLARAWTVQDLAQAALLSRAQLTRILNQHLGVPPMRLLSELRLTEFVRLLEETSLPIGLSARRVGWRDPRVAARWFRRRYGISPSVFRSQPAHACAGDLPCALCMGPCLFLVRTGEARASGRSLRALQGSSSA